MKNILVVDDHVLFLEGLGYILSNLDEEINVISANSASHALGLSLQRDDLHLVLLDLTLPDMHGLEALKIFSENFPSLPIVILSASENCSDMQAALGAGAKGYIIKSEKGSIMLQVIRLVLEGGVYIPPGMVYRVPGIAVERQTFSALSPVSYKTPNIKHDVKLTARQLEILPYVVDGLTNKEICSILNVTEATVKAHVSGILKALKIKNRTSVAKVVSEQGMATQD